MTRPFEIVGDDAPACIDGVCELPSAAEARTLSPVAPIHHSGPSTDESTSGALTAH